MGGHGKKKYKCRQKDNGATGVWIDAPPSEPEAYAAYIAKITQCVHSNLVEPTFDMSNAVEEFADANGLKCHNVSDKFPPYSNRNPKRALDFNFRIASLAAADHSTIYFYICDEYNYDACRVIGCHILISQECPIDTTSSLSFVVYLGDNFVYGQAVDTARKFRTHLNALLDSWACCLCLNDLSEITQAFACWDCMHSLCSECIESDDFKVMNEQNTPCPMCRAPLAKRVLVNSVVDLTTGADA
jgi:hypothetical protein